MRFLLNAPPPIRSAPKPKPRPPRPRHRTRSAEVAPGSPTASSRRHRLPECASCSTPLLRSDRLQSRSRVRRGRDIVPALLKLRLGHPPQALVVIDYQNALLAQRPSSDLAESSGKTSFRSEEHTS